ncbi:amino acid ABC transporter ATP-binding protein [Aliiroseovarius sp. F47248L]|uniref:amino acid ABC transporter ATP-binding protein n=1 Tax=Aliiroseovarius sp. F47248L TaxID=2926420 RepID=UPI00248BDD4D|nr:amino acid ABC transporter ATP-binding protein [Aliiroseovarius sp. F47248L]
MSILRLSNVTKSFGQTAVLRGIDLEVNEGEMICLIGASGSGKSTLLRTINLLEPIDDGEIWFDGHDISLPDIAPQPVRRKIGLVFQSFNLFPHMTAVENVLLAPSRVFQRSKKDLLPNVTRLFERFNLKDRMNAYPDQLSGGQQQRVAIVRALAMQPKIMLFDEVTSALDPELVSEVLETLLKLKAQSMTMILATHEMGFAREAADRVCVLDGGKIIETGTPDQIFNAPQTKRAREFLASVI